MAIADPRMRWPVDVAVAAVVAVPTVADAWWNQPGTRAADGLTYLLVAVSLGALLAGMAERAAMIGGRVRHGPMPGGGFRVRAVLPVAGEPL